MYKAKNTEQLEFERIIFRAIKRRKHTHKGLRKALRQQLQYIRRNIHHIEALIQRGAVLEGLTRQQYRNFLVVGEVYRQQKQMYDEKEHNIRLSGPRLGRPVNDNSYSDKQEQADRAQRNAIEGSFGTGKRRYG